MQCRIPRGAGAPLGTYARTAPPEASRFLLPPARRCRSSPPRKARRRALLQTPRPAGRRAWQGRRWAAPLMLGTLAACLRFRRPRGRGRRSALLNVGPRLAACRRWSPSRRLAPSPRLRRTGTPPGSARPSSLSSWGARAFGRSCGLTGRPHRKTCRLRRQQPAKRRTQAARSGRPHRLLCAPLCSGWTPELFAAWPLSRHSTDQNGPR